MEKEYPKGSYGYDRQFFERMGIPVIELSDSNSGGRVLIVPEYQGRVMTSSAEADSGPGFGWINYRFIETGKRSSQFNPFGGEERIWLGPEGGPFSIYFRKDQEQIFANWKVPSELDTIPFNLVSAEKNRADFSKSFFLFNSSGNKLSVGVKRSIKLLNLSETETAIGLKMGDSVKSVAYESNNTLINEGNEAWTRETGFLSVWMLAMFNPSSKGVVFIPFKEGEISDLGNIVTDDYFGKVPPERLVVKGNILFFSVDGRHRSKIGISPQRAMPFCGSYDPDGKILTILWFTIPPKAVPYVNSKWGVQDDPLKGDAVNSYNDGPVEDGSIMGPFYEIESSSPAALLKPGEEIIHTQRIFHFTGNEETLSNITEQIFGITIKEIKDSLIK